MPHSKFESFNHTTHGIFFLLFFYACLTAVKVQPRSIYYSKPEEIGERDCLEEEIKKRTPTLMEIPADLPENFQIPYTYSVFFVVSFFFMLSAPKIERSFLLQPHHWLFHPAHRIVSDS